MFSGQVFYFSFLIFSPEPNIGQRNIYLDLACVYFIIIIITIIIILVAHSSFCLVFVCFFVPVIYDFNPTQSSHMVQYRAATNIRKIVAFNRDQ